MKVIHSWLKEYVGDVLPEPSKVEELFNSYAFEIDGSEKVEGEDVIDVDILPNRASDCLCHRGIARELATILDVSLKADPLQESVDLVTTDKIEVSISDSKACPRFTASLVTGIEVKDSPEWLQKRIKALGQRPINNIVDATNYVMYAIGQPLHAYDADKFPQVGEKWQFGVRFAEEGETVSLLAEGGKDEDRIVELKGSELLIVDGSSNTPVGLAGVKGGRYAEVVPETKNIIIEAAHFHPTITRKTARRLGIVIDASKRFENEPSRELPLYAQRDIVKLITDIAGGEFEGVVDEYLVKQEVATVTVSIEKVNSLLGLSLSAEEVKTIIERTGSVVEVGENEGQIIVTSPWERTDLNIEEDYIEEVGRLHGLSNIESVVPETTPLTEINSRQYYSDKIRQALLAVSFSEIITSSFQKKGKLQLQNSLASDKSYLRSSLVKNITKALDVNYGHTDLLGIKDVRVFEIGTVFKGSEAGVVEHVSVALGARVKGDGYNPKDDALLKIGCEAIKAVLGVDIEWSVTKGVAEMNLSELLSELPKPDKYESLAEKESAVFKAVSPYPAIARDISLWVSDVETVEMVANTLIESAGPFLVRHDLFDTFTKEGRTSYAFRLVFQAKDKTLTDEEINEVMSSINAMAAKQAWEVR